jgi:hypothetical protein
MKTRIQTQKRCAVFKSQEVRDGKARTIWYTLVHPVDKPLLVAKGKRKGQKVIHQDVRERWATQAEADARKQAIDEFFFPTSTEVKMPIVPTWLSKAQVKNTETVLLAKANDAGWGNSANLILQMFDFCKLNGFVPAARGGSPRWNDAMKRYLEARKNGEDAKMSARKDTLQRYKELERITGVVFARFRMNQVTKSFIEKFMKSAAPIQVFYATNEEGIYRQEDFKGVRPFTWTQRCHHTRTISAFINWCAARGWCSPIHLPLPVMPREKKEQELPALTLEQVQITLARLGGLEEF